MAVMLFVWFGFAASAIFYFVDWTPVWQQLALEWRAPLNGRNAGSQSGDKAGHQGGNLMEQAGIGDRIYTGSILVPEHRNLCSQYGFDNRNGATWHIGSVDCVKARLQYRAQEKAKRGGDERLLAIKRSFRNAGN
ncbi:hypothetical protein [Pseudolabrys sp.]|uniref:hypothetical protein n=1 Tax=Pseudolabrys sp. TaxID=1960880 RepID=UPI003D15076E